MSSSTTPTLAGLRAEAEKEGTEDPASISSWPARPRGPNWTKPQLAAVLHIEGTPALAVRDRLIPAAVPLDDLQQAVAAARSSRQLCKPSHDAG